MPFTKNYMTLAGVNLAAKVLAGENLVITRVLGGSGEDPGGDYSRLSSLVEGGITMQTPQGLYHDAEIQNRVHIPVYYENHDLPSPFKLSEIGVYAEDPDNGEILFCIAPGYDAPFTLPSSSEGRVELTIDLMVDLLLTYDATIILPPSLVFLTKPEAMALFAPKKHRHPATEIDESTGETTEEAQRRQDAKIDLIEEMVSSGTRSAQQVEIGSREPLLWKIIDYKGWYDKELSCYRAGGNVSSSPASIEPMMASLKAGEPNVTYIGRPPGGR